MPTPLTDEQVTDALESLPGWSRKDGKLHKEYKCKDFREALAFIVRIGFEAEQRNHHPELTNVYNNVTIDLCTHDADGKVTKKDADLALAIEQVAPKK